MFTGNIVQEKRWVIPSNGSTQNPGLSFFSGRSSGFSRVESNVVVSMQGIQLADMSTTQLTVFGNVTGNLVGNGSGITKNPLISNIQIANSSYVVQDDTAVSVDGGYVVVNGSNFAPGTSVTVGGTQASSVTFVSTSRLNVQVPAKAAGSYTVVVTRGDGTVATVPLGITYSPTPVWSTGSTLANVTKNTAFTQTLAATEANGSSIVYTIDTGSSLPPGVSLSLGGTLSGNITTDISNTTVYSFTIQATDLQMQNIPRTFGLTVVAFLISTITYSQSSVYPGGNVANQPATQEYMRDSSYTSSIYQTGTLGSGSEWIMMDFGSQYAIKRIAVGCDFNNVLVGGWGKSYTENKNVEYSTNGSTWTYLFNTGTFTAGIQSYNVNVTARYVRIIANGYLALTEFDAFLK